MLTCLNELVERRIAAARSEGAFEDLPGKGRPLDLREDPLVPEEMRVANRILKNAGMVPPGVAELNALGALRRALEAAGQSSDGDPQVRQRLRRRLLAISLALRSRGTGTDVLADPVYAAGIIDRLSRR